MDSLVNKPFLIGTAIFITLAITTGIILVFNSVFGIYQGVYNTEIGIKSKFGDYAMYDNTVMSGLELYNTVKKYNKDNYVSVYVEGNEVKIDETSDVVVLNNSITLVIDPNFDNDAKKTYNVTYETDEDYCKIYFKKITS